MFEAITQSSVQHLSSASSSPAVTIAAGDGIGPEIMESVRFLLAEGGAKLDLHDITIGSAAYEKGYTSGIEPEAWDTLRQDKVFLKAPITTPQGGGYKSLNVTVRKTLGLFANIRPCVTYHPFVATNHPGMDVVIIRENEEDTYGGIEHRQTAEVTQCLKLITRPGCEKIVRYAFAYAEAHGRQRVTCFTKDNIMKLTDGLFSKVFREVAAEYPDLESDHQIIDIGTARLADNPAAYDVIVLPNLYGDIVSDVAAQLTGSVGLAGSANIGEHCAMFEAVHGSAPDIAGQDLANPSGLLQAAVLMLVHLGQADVAQRLRNAWLCTLEQGQLTADICPKDKTPLGTKAFTRAIASHLGEEPQTLDTAHFQTSTTSLAGLWKQPEQKPVKELLGVDVFLDWDQDNRDPDILGRALKAAAAPDLTLKMITNRGTKVYPDGLPETFCTDHWRCRFTGLKDEGVRHQQIIGLLSRLAETGFDFIKTEHLYSFDGERGYSLGQGE